MVALAAALGVFHVAQQAVHFRQGQAAVGADGAVAGHGAEQFVDMRLDTVAGAVLHQVCQYVGHQAVGLGLLEQRGNLADRQGFRAQALQLEAQLLEHAVMFFCAVGFTLAHRQGFRHQQRLAAEAFAGHGDLQALVHDPLMGSVHVHQHQAMGVFGEDINAFELRQGIAQRRNITAAFGQRHSSTRLGTRQRREKLTVRRLGFGHRRRRLRARCVLVLITRTGNRIRRRVGWLRLRRLQQVGRQAHLALGAELAGFRAARPHHRRDNRR